METHPIPQQISSYQFRLVGDMTLKQFFQLGGGALIALLIYSTGLHPLIKWPLILISVSLGAALAFLPLEERPLSRWIFTFFRSVYSPTVYLWQKNDQGYNFFQPEEVAQTTTQISTQPKTEEQFQKPATEQEKSLNKLEAGEKNFLSRIFDIFKQETTVIKPIEKQPTTTFTTAPSNTVLPSHPPTIQPNVAVPATEVKYFRPKIVVEETIAQGQTEKQLPNISLHQVAPILKESQIKSEQAQFSAQAAPPLPPTIPNTITGQVLDSQGKIIEGAILEVRDIAGRPVRAIRSNKLGHFMIVTALNNGQYDITTEKEGYQFDPTTFEAKGEIIPPILIKAKPAQNQ